VYSKTSLGWRGDLKKTEIIVAGHGGQGVLDLANYLSFYEMLSGKHVAYTPSYGPESRGGKVKCYVVASDDEIACPIVEEPECLIVMNLPSMDFVPLLKPGGFLLMNSSLIPETEIRDNIRVIKVPATEIADHLEKPEGVLDSRIAANCVMLGAYFAAMGQDLDRGFLDEVFQHFLTDRKKAYIELDLRAVEKGYDFVCTASMLKAA